MRSGLWRQSGFSLMEILVAFSILSISLGALLSVFGQGLRIAATSKHYSEAAIIAESRFAEVGSVQPLESMHDQGSSGNYQWEVIIAPYTWPETDVDPALENNANALEVFSVEVKVAWTQGVRNPFISIQSLKLKAQ